MSVKVANYSELKKKIDERDGDALDILVKRKGVAYVVAVTREKCPGCDKQKPLFEKLANKMKEKHAAQVEFFRVHSWFSQEEKEEARRCADAFRTVAFPTYIIAVKDDEGKSRETYRSIQPSMSEIERNIKTSMQVAVWFKPKKK